MQCFEVNWKAFFFFIDGSSFLIIDLFNLLLFEQIGINYDDSLKKNINVHLYFVAIDKDHKFIQIINF